VPTVTCPLCRRTIESGPEHCPHCHIRLPGAPVRKPAPVKRAGGGTLRRGTRSSPAPTGAPGQCPACMHPISSTDQWCKWCKWPVNRD
jgi:hypothetical protein